MKVLLIGYGSIGKRHYEVLNSFEKVKSIDLVTKQDIKNIITYKDLEDIKDLNAYDYFFVASETVKLSMLRLSPVLFILQYMVKYFKGMRIKVNRLNPSGIFDNQMEDFFAKKVHRRAFKQGNAR